MKIFVAFPYRLDEHGYRDALRAKFAGSEVEFLYADERIDNKHVLQKIREMMAMADTCMFDITDNNSNVMLELGIALGEQHPGFVAVDAGKVARIGADVVGWDQLRYSSYEELADKLHEYLDRGALPIRRSAPVASEQINVLDLLRSLHFGVPAGQADATLSVFAVPVPYHRYYRDWKALKTEAFNPRTLVRLITDARNDTRERTTFWSMGYNWDPAPAADFVDIYDGGAAIGNPSTRDANFRLYTSGAAIYTMRFDVNPTIEAPFVYLHALQTIVNTALHAIARVRSNAGFDAQGMILVGAGLLNAQTIRLSTATPDFYPMGDRGHTLVDAGDEMLFPEQPIPIESRMLLEEAPQLAELIVNEVRRHLEPTQKHAPGIRWN